MIKDHFSSLSFKTKLQLTTASLCVLIAFLSMSAIEKISRESTQEKIGLDFVKTRAALNHLVGEKISAFKDAIDRMLSDPIFRSQVSRTNQLSNELGLGSPSDSKADQAKLMREANQIFLSVDLPIFHQYPVFSIINENGVLLFSRAAPGVFGNDVSHILWIQQVLDEGSALQLISVDDSTYVSAGIVPESKTENDLYLIYGQAILSGSKSVGIVIAAEKVSEALLKPIRDSFFSTLVLKSQDGHLASADSGFGPKKLDFLKTLNLIEANPDSSTADIQSLNVDRENLLVLHAQITHGLEKSTIGSMYLLRSLDVEMKPFLKKVRIAFIIILFVSTLFSFGAVTLLAKHMTKPLFSLEQGMKKLQSGDLSVQVPQTSLDEIGYLTKAFNKMAIGLKEKTQIESLLGKLRDELTAARDIQRSLLPPENQRFDSISLDCLYRPCEELSGDFFDSILVEDWLYFYLADVTSHGTAAAQVTYLMKEIFRSELRENVGINLPDLLGKVSLRYAAYQLKYDVGLHAARINQKTFELQNVRSNAPSAVLIQNKATSLLDPTPGPLLNASFVGGHLAFQVKSSQLKRGDQVYFFTDGAYEFDFGNGIFATKRFYPLLLSASESKQANQWKTTLFQSLVQANRSEMFEDDITIVKLSV